MSTKAAVYIFTYITPLIEFSIYVYTYINIYIYIYIRLNINLVIPLNNENTIMLIQIRLLDN